MQMSDSHPSPAERRSPRRPRANLRKLMFVLPNLFTVSSIFCGVYSITLSAGEPTGDNFYRAAVAIFFGSFFDAFDGRVARLTRTQSDFGVELDSLADVITFGVAPAILVYKWALAGWAFPESPSARSTLPAERSGWRASTASPTPSPAHRATSSGLPIRW